LYDGSATGRGLVGGGGAPDHGRKHVESALGGNFFPSLLLSLPGLLIWKARMGWKFLFHLEGRIGPGGRSIGRSGRTFAGEKLRRGGAFLISRWVGLVVVTVVVGGRGLTAAGYDHVAGGADGRVEEEVTGDKDEDDPIYSEQFGGLRSRTLGRMITRLIIAIRDCAGPGAQRGLSPTHQTRQGGN